MKTTRATSIRESIVSAFGNKLFVFPSLVSVGCITIRLIQLRRRTSAAELCFALQELKKRMIYHNNLPNGDTPTFQYLIRQKCLFQVLN